MISQHQGGYNLGEMKKLDWAALFVVVFFLISGILTLSHYGLSWDEGLGNLFFGERYLLFLTSFEEKYLDFKNELPYHHQRAINTYQAPFRDSPNEFPPVTDIFSAAGMYLTAYWLDLLNPVDGWHSFTVVLAGIFLGIFYRFFSQRIGRLPAFLGTVFLASFPRFWGDMHFNPKDVPETIWISLVLMAYSIWYEKPRPGQALLVGVLFAFALGTKVNALIVPLMIVFGVWPWRMGINSWKKNLQHIRKQLIHYLLMFSSFLSVYFLSWPYLYANPQRLINYYTYIFFQGGRQGAGINGEIWQQVVFTMPEVMLLCLLIGLVYLVLNAKKGKTIWPRFLLIWLLFPLLRASLPGMVNFDGIRHFLEFLPAAALIAGLGGSQLISMIENRLKGSRVAVSTAFAVLLVINYTSIYWTYHPFQHLYYNRIVGGLPGASEVFGPNEATDYWAASYRQGMDWLTENATSEAGLYTPVAPWLVDITAPLWLRPDLEILPEFNRGQITSLDSDLYVMFITRPVFYDQVAQYCVENLTPVYAIPVDGVEVLQIYCLECK